LLTNEELITLFGERIDDINIKIEKFKQLKESNCIIKAGINWELPTYIKIDKIIELENENSAVANEVIRYWIDKSDNFKFECIKNVDKFKNRNIKNYLLDKPFKKQETKNSDNVLHLSDKEKNELFLNMTHEPTIRRVAIEWRGLRRENLDKKFLELKSHDNILFAGKYWNVSDEAKNKKFMEITESDAIYNKNFIFNIVESWRGIREENLEKKFMQLTNIHLIDNAVNDWNLSDSIVNKKFLSFWDDENQKMKYDECHIYAFGVKWRSLYEETLNDMFTKLRDKYYICMAWLYWRGITDESKKIQIKYLKSI